MLKILLIDNDERNYLTLKQIISQLDFLYSNNLIVQWFKSCTKELIDTINEIAIKKIYLINNNYKINQKNLANYVRMTDYRSELILLGENNENWINNIFDFLPNVYENSQKIWNDLKQILDNYYIGNFFSYTNSKMNLNIYCDSILYIYRDTSERKIVIVTNHRNYTLNISLNEIMKRLDSRFRQVHRACILNICHVYEYNWAKSYFILDNGKKVNLLSKKYRFVLF